MGGGRQEFHGHSSVTRGPMASVGVSPDLAHGGRSDPCLGVLPWRDSRLELGNPWSDGFGGGIAGLGPWLTVGLMSRCAPLESFTAIARQPVVGWLRSGYRGTWPVVDCPPDVSVCAPGEFHGHSSATRGRMASVGVSADLARGGRSDPCLGVLPWRVSRP